MNKLKRTLALMAVLAMTATAFAGCGDESSSSSSSSQDSVESSVEDSVEESSDEGGEESSDENSAAAPVGAPTPDGTLGDDDGTLSILCWTDTDLKAMFDVTTAENATYVPVGADGSEASEQYLQYFSSGDDCDLYICDADWVMSYENNDDVSAPLSALGITADMYGDAYDYTVAIGTDANGVLKGASWQAAAGGYAYRTDLAEQYLGVKSPDEMQAKIGDWDSFWATAKEVYDASEGVTAMADTIDGVWRAYSAGNRTSAWIDESGKFQYDSAVTDFIDMIKTNADAGYVNMDISQWTNDWYAIGFANGTLANKTMGYFFPSWSLSATGQLASAEGYQAPDPDNGIEEGWNDVGTKGMYAYTAGPTGWYWGGSWLCVSPNCNSATAAAQFVYDMTINPETMKAYALNHSDFVNNKTVMAEIIAEGSNSNELFKDGQDQFAVLADSAAQINLDGIAGENDGTINTAFVDSVKAYAKGDLKDADETINNFLDAAAAKLPDVVFE